MVWRYCCLKNARHYENVWHLALRYLADGHWYTLAESAQRLHVTAQMMRAALRQCMRMGAPLQLDMARGFRFVQPVSPLIAARERLPLPVQAFWMTDSTNTRALAALGAGLTRREARVADYQTQGRGRAERRWHQGLGCGVSVSLAFPAHEALALEALSLRVGLALAEALQRMGVADVKLKWPNDVMWQGKKLGGILIEARRTGVVVGVGLNYLRLRHETGAILQPVTSLQAIMGRRLPRRARVLARVLGGVLRELRTLSCTWQTRFAYFDALQGQAVRVMEAFQASWCGVAEGVDARGFLRVRTGAEVRLCHAGEVSVRVNEFGQEQSA